MNEDTNINFDTLIVGQIETKAKWQKQLTDLETQVALGKDTPANKVDIANCKKKIKDADEAIADLNKQRKEYNVATKEETQAVSLNEERLIVTELIEKNNIGYLADSNKYIYCVGMQADSADIVNPIFKTTEAAKFGRVLGKLARLSNKTLNKLCYKTYQEDLADHFGQTGNDYLDETTSFLDAKWSREKIYNRGRVIRNFWVQPDYAEAENYDKRFDFLIYCIGSGKSENMDHLEQWLAYKYLYPERAGNTPNLDIGGYPGGNGKGRYIELCKTIFTNPCVVGAALKELMDGFNGNWGMATVLYYDEPAANELPEGKLKQATGGEDMRQERKGVDATIVDRNYSILFVSNNPNGVAKLSGTGSGGEDRRYSVMITDKVMLDEAINLGLAKDEAEAKIFVNSINDLIKQRKEVAKWLAYVIKKHKIDEMVSLPPLHGEDYRKRFEDQKNTVDTAFDLILPVFQYNKCLPSKILHEVVIAITGLDKLSQKKCGQQWERYLGRSKVPFKSAKQRVKNKFNDEYLFEKQGATYYIDGEVEFEFDHASIADDAPTKDTKYDATSIILGKDIDAEIAIVSKPKQDASIPVIDTTNKKMSVLDQVKARQAALSAK